MAGDFSQQVRKILHPDPSPSPTTMLFRALVLALAINANGLRIATAASRVSTPTMGLSVGDKFPASALKKCGVSGKKAVVFFYGADDAPSCSKEISAFDAASAEFKDAGIAIVGVRNEAGVKPDTSSGITLVVDEGDAMRTEIGIEKDLFGLLGGRETYVLDGAGNVVSVHNNQFDPDSHVKVALAAIDELPKSPVDELLEQIKSALSSIAA